MTNVSFGNDVRFTGHYSQAVPKPDNRPPRSLAQAVELAVGHVDAASLELVAPTDAGPAFEPPKVLALLTFCYARQLYSSRTIAAQLRRDFNSLRINGNPLPDAAMLKRFRCVNRGALDFCLKSALLFLAEEKVRQGFVTHVKERHIIQEASRRIVMAMFTDSLEMESEREPEAGLELSFEVAMNRSLVH
jgi:hypothetical protein